MEVIIAESAAKASLRAAQIIARQVRDKPDSVLGLATGGTPLGLYRELIRMHREEGLDFGAVTTFNLDEYLGLGPDHPASFRAFMNDNLFHSIDLPAERTFVPDGLAGDIPAHCAAYEAAITAAGGIDIQVLGIGSDGHIGFNEPSSSLASRTRLATLAEKTIQDNARFFASPDEVPCHAITMGVGTILESRACLVLAFGEQKAAAVAGMIEGPVTAMLPASALQLHPWVQVLIDEPAASRLTRAHYYRKAYSPGTSGGSR